jgi:HNH endonuclease
MGKRGPKPRSEIRRFWEKTHASGACLLWVGYVGSNGYGYFDASAPGTKRRARTVSAHRFIYERVLGRLPRDLDVMHSCDNRSCVALQHLSSGTRKVNMTDAQNKQRLGRRLSDDKVREIRRRYTAGEQQAALASEYGVSQVMISRIIVGKAWAHVRDI